LADGFERVIPPPGIRLAGDYTLGGARLFTADLHLRAGEWTCLLGRSGTGKSTILRLLLGLATGGTFAGDIAATDGSDLRNCISYMAQSDLLLPWLPVLDNVCIGSRLRGEPPDRDRAAELLDRVGLGPAAQQMPGQLSGGMRQRVALARTLFEDRPVTLLDEPFSALDASTRADMQDLAAEALSGRTVLLVTHDPAEAARLAHQIILLSAHGTQHWPVPPATPPRAIDDPATIASQSRLLAHLRSAAA
jgi:putative hydroxymethylpyrimidine transport system ATP-binding protein